MVLSKKSKFGQFFTTNYEYILQNMCIPENIKTIIEPFTGNGDLIEFAKHFKTNFECYDVEPKHEWINKRDTLIDPPNYADKFVLTNPPYLARNKNYEKTIYDLYNENDLYKCFIMSLITSNNENGILIIPLNFFCSIRKSDITLRRKFLHKYKIIKINIFEEQVFDDTTYAICSFQYEKRKEFEKDIVLSACIYPVYKKINFVLNEQNKFIIGGEIYNTDNCSKYKISRLTKDTKLDECITNILLKSIDDKEKINLKFVDDTNKYIDNTDKHSNRSYAILVVYPVISIEQQKKLIKDFNEYLNKNRETYNSLFLTNYREFNRKRISFKLAFNICINLMNNWS